MSKREAIRLLVSVWGMGETISAAEAARLTSLEEPGETLLDTCARLAGADIRGINAFDHFAIRGAAARAEVRACFEWTKV